jgi:hypothetical protein
MVRASKGKAMNAAARETFATEIDADILRILRGIAEREGQPLQALVEEALADLVKKRDLAEPRPHVLAAYQASHDTYAPLYKKLAE